MAEHTQYRFEAASGVCIGPPLSPRELDVLSSLARGDSNRAIAARLGIGVRTVKMHLTQLYNKLGVDSRAEAVAVARERGWVLNTSF